MTSYGKVEVPLDRREWRPTPLIEQVVLVTTINRDQEPHVATKSRVSIVTYGPPAVVFFACRAEFVTAKNILKTEQFIINVPSDDLVATSWVLGSDPSGFGADRFEDNGLTPIPAVKLDAPRIAECQAHLECELVETRPFEEDFAVFGRVVSVTMNERVLAGSATPRYRTLAPFFFLEAGWTASMGSARLVEKPIPGPRHDRTVLPVSEMARSVEFYRQVFGWPVSVEDPNYVEFELPKNRRLALCRRETIAKTTGVPLKADSADALSGLELHFYGEDAPHIVARLVGAQAQQLTHPSKFGRFDDASYFVDPDGHLLVISLRPTGTPDQKTDI